MLEIADLTHIYANGIRALDGVSLSIPTGMFGLLGPTAPANSAASSRRMTCCRSAACRSGPGFRR